MKKILITFVLCAASVPCVASAAPTTEAQVVLNLPSSADNPRNSEGDFIRLKDGRILFIYSHYTNKGKGGDHDPACLAARESADGGRTWSANDVIVVENEGGMNVMSVSLARLGDGSIALFYLRKNSECDCRPVMRLSTDEAKTWGPARSIIPDAEVSYYVLNNSRVLQLPNGRIVLPLSVHASKDGHIGDEAGKLLCYISDDRGRTWHRSRAEPFPTFDAHGKRIMTQEPGLVALKDGRVLMHARTERGRQWFYYSSDACETWTKGEPGTLCGPLGPATIRRLANGDLLAIWNDHERHPEFKKGGPGTEWAHGLRKPLTLGISKDEGRTWPIRSDFATDLNGTIRRDVETDPHGWYCYFAPLEIDGRLLVGCSAQSGLRQAQVLSVSLDGLYAKGWSAVPVAIDGLELTVTGPREGKLRLPSGRARFVVDFDDCFVTFADATGKPVRPWRDWCKYTLDLGPDPVSFKGGRFDRARRAQLPLGRPDELCGAKRDQPFAQLLKTGVVCREPGRYLGWPTVMRRKNGEILVVFSGDRDQHVCPHGKVQLVRSSDDGEQWSAPETIVNGPLDDRDAGLIELDDGTLVLKYFTSVHFTKCGVRAWNDYHRSLSPKTVSDNLGSFILRSTDGGRTWSDRARVRGSAPHGMIALRDGRLLLVGTSDGEGEGKRVQAEASEDGGRTWKVIGQIDRFPAQVAVKDLWEPHVTECADGSLVALIRWEPGALVQSRSTDGGRTWSAACVTEINGFPPHLVTLPNGNLLCSYACRQPGRWGVYARLSADHGRTWNAAGEIVLDRLPHPDFAYPVDFGYPSTTLLPDGSLLTVYYRQDQPGELPSVLFTRWRLLQGR